MKRYGDNLPSPNIFEEELNNERGRSALVMYGGCGVRFGTFSKPTEHPQKHKPFDLLLFLGLKKITPKEDKG
jgi:hypothetical protein